MEIYFNELSCLPKSENEFKAKSKVYILLEAMKKLREHDINILRTHNNFYGEELCKNYTISNFITDSNVSPSLKLLLRSFIKNPFIVDDNSPEAELFLQDTYLTKDYKNETVSPEGLAIAFINNSPSLSFSGFEKWEDETLELIVNQEEQKIVNISTYESTNNAVFLDWLISLAKELKLNCEKNIIDFFSFGPFYFEQRAIDDIIAWYFNDKRYLNRIKILIRDILQNPFIGGKGHTEILSNTNGKSSKRIVDKDRIVYTYAKERITIHQCRYHYEDK